MLLCMMCGTDVIVPIHMVCGTDVIVPIHIWNIIKNIKITKTARKIFSQTDQKKQPCLAVKACQVRD